MAGVVGERRGDGGALALEAGRVDAGAGADPVGGVAAEQAAEDRRGDGRVADAHLADAQQIDAAGDRLHAEGHGRRRRPPRRAPPRTVMSPVGMSSARS